MRLHRSILVGVPLAPVEHAATDPAYAASGMVVDHAQIGQRWTPADDAAHVGWSDRQHDPTFPSTRYAGSARSVFYRGHYLKGVGRTPLWLDWKDGCADMQHGSGHLFPSSATREYLVSAYCEARGILAGIVPCKAVLARPLEADLRQAIHAEDARQRSDGAPPLCPADRSLRALSIKPADFARWSNVHQLLLTTATRPRALSDTFDAAAMAFGIPGGDRRRVDLEQIGDRIEAGLDHLIANLAAFFRAGVLWGSLNNNFSIDGRCVDIEVSTVTCERMMVRSVTRRAGRETFGLLTGTEFVVLVDEARHAFRAIARQIARLADDVRIPHARAVLRRTRRYFERRFGRGFWLWRERDVLDRFGRILGPDVDRRLATRLYRYELSHRPRSIGMDSVPLPLQGVGCEPWSRPDRLERLACPAPSDAALSDIRFYNACVEEADAQTTPEGYVRALLDARAAMLVRYARP